MKNNLKPTGISVLTKVVSSLRLSKDNHRINSNITSIKHLSSLNTKDLLYRDKVQLTESFSRNSNG